MSSLTMQRSIAILRVFRMDVGAILQQKANRLSLT
jgi:hypothetical protein